jgi:excinuclease UvrABC nuclease subunit
MKFSTEAYLDELMNELVQNGMKHPIELTRAWARKFPNEAGVYILFEGKTLVYVGETKSIRERMLDYLDTRHHTVRRKLGLFNFSEVDGFERAGSKIKYPPHIEMMVDDWFKNNVLICFLVVSLGRKELEELIMQKYKPKYNSLGRRGNNYDKN